MHIATRTLYKTRTKITLAGQLDKWDGDRVTIAAEMTIERYTQAQEERRG